MKLTPKDKVDIIQAYTEQLTPIKILANQYKVTRQAVYKMLKQAGIDTSKHPLTVSCSACNAHITRHKHRIRKQLNHFCGYDCYYAYLEAGNGNPYIQNRQGHRIARQKVTELFDLKKHHVVHHKDRNTLNNMLHNLKVFANQGDHIRHHRGFTVTPIWDGNTLNTF